MLLIITLFPQDSMITLIDSEKPKLEQKFVKLTHTKNSEYNFLAMKVLNNVRVISICCGWAAMHAVVSHGTQLTFTIFIFGTELAFFIKTVFYYQCGLAGREGDVVVSEWDGHCYAVQCRNVPVRGHSACVTWADVSGRWNIPAQSAGSACTRHNAATATDQGTPPLATVIVGQE